MGLVGLMHLLIASSCEGNTELQSNWGDRERSGNDFCLMRECDFFFVCIHSHRLHDWTVLTTVDEKFDTCR